MLMTIIGLALMCVLIVTILAITFKWHDDTQNHFNCTPYSGPIYNRHGREISK